MKLIDIHTHNKEQEGIAIYNSDTSYLEDRPISMGLHPWDIGDDWKEKFIAVAEKAEESNVVAIGECGLDKARTEVPFGVQEEVFRAHIELSEKLHKPLIIHCVKAHDRVLALHKEISPSQAWAIHGFRGKPQLAMQLAKAGIYLSFGELFNAESIKAVPQEMILIESDESSKPVREIYRAIAAARGTTIEELAGTVEENAVVFTQFRPDRIR